MSRRNRMWLQSPLWMAAWVALALQCALPAWGSSIVLKDGRTIGGRIGEAKGMAVNPAKPDEGNASIVFVDDELRRVFVPKFRIKEIIDADTGDPPERIAIKQSVADSGYQMQRVGPILKTTPFSEYGRRTLTMNTNKGPLEVIQGITMITPEWTKVEGLRTSSRQPIVWDMRIATSSIPTTTLEAILSHVIDPKDIDQRLKVVRLLFGCERYKESMLKLEQIVKDFPDEKQLVPQVRALRQEYARSIVAEIDVRQDARQHGLVYNKMLPQFPSDDVAGEILQQVKEMLDEYKQQLETLKRTYNELKAHIEAMSAGPQREQCEAMLEEMGRELGINTMDRLTDYLRLRDDDKLGGEQKLSLAISGWLLGPNKGDTNLAITLSLVQVRDLVRKYLNESAKVNRDQLLDQLKANEGASAPQIAALLANMKPPLETPPPSREQPGLYQLSVPVGIHDEPDVRYHVQLPPEYDPYVRYPTIVTLNGAGTTPLQQIDWWAGHADNEGRRLGHATRFGYIVIAVEWAKTAQTEYEFTAREHSAVLASLRDACRRFAIDTDRLFLSGHSMGGTAAWDIGLAHPDTWAGVLPIVAEVDKYCSRYWENAALVPFYFVSGEMDGDKTVKNAADMDRYMQGRFDVTINEYIGRGHEDFYEDIRNMFDWMSRRQRDFFPKEFTVSTMRPWDNYFWWFEGRDFPERAMVDPVEWPPQRGVRPLQITGKRTAKNGVSLSTGDCQATLWLSPELVDFTQRVSITVNGRTLKSGGSLIEPDLAVLLEDARTRADRMHPFWAKIEPR